MQAPQSASRTGQRRSPAADPAGPAPPTQPFAASSSNNGATSTSGPRSSSGSARSAHQRKNPSQQLSQIEKSVTHLLIATKQLLETLTMWSRHTATEGEVSDVYVRLGYEFNIACRAFSAIGVDTADLGPVPDLLRNILEDTLSQEASPASLEKFLPKIRDIIINLLHGLKRKQSKLRTRQAKDGVPTSQPQNARQTSVASTSSGETGLTTLLDDAQQTSRKSGTSMDRRDANGYSSAYTEELGVPPRTSSVQNGVTSPTRESIDMPFPYTLTQDSKGSDHSMSDSSLSSSTAQGLPVLTPDRYVTQDHPPSNRPAYTNHPPPPPPPKQQDALLELQRGGELERRASRRYSAYQLQKQLGSGGVPMLPPQNSPIPNRGREVRDSLNAVRTRGTALPSRQRSNRADGAAPGKSNLVSNRISEESFQSADKSTKMASERSGEDEKPQIQVTGDAGEPTTPNVDPEVELDLGPTLTSPLHDSPQGLTNGIPEGEVEQPMGLPEESHRQGSSVSALEDQQSVIPTEDQYVPELSPQPGKELTLFLQYKSKIKKFVLPDGASELSMARLQLAFIEKFAWNTHSNGLDLPEIYIQDSVSGVRHELEDLIDVKDRSVLVLNVEVLDEVKKHVDEGLGGIRTLIEGLRGVVESHQTSLQQVVERQQDTAKDIAKLAATPPGSATIRSTLQVNGSARSSSSLPSTDVTQQRQGISALRRDLAVVRQTYTSFASDVTASMTAIRAKAAQVKTTSVQTAIPAFDENSGRTYVNKGKKTVGEESENIVNRVDDLQDMVEDLRKDVVTRGVRPLPRQLDTVSKDISIATAELKKMQEFLRREKPVWTKIWAKELDIVCNDREFLTMQEELVADLEDDLEKATQTFALVEQATRQQHLQASHGQSVTLRSTSRGTGAGNGPSIGPNGEIELDPRRAKDGVLGEVKALQPNHESRLEAIERAEKARQRELEDRKDSELFKKELGSFVDEGRLKKSGGVEEAERLRKAKDEKNRVIDWENQLARDEGKAREKSGEGVDVAAAEPEPKEATVQPSVTNGDEHDLAQTNGTGGDSNEGSISGQQTPEQDKVDAAAETTSPRPGEETPPPTEA
ncbi:Bud site selection protein 6 [Agyrium rufum]|nr:Bud site selection protein 6 [Agyrium rufum]